MNRDDDLAREDIEDLMAAECWRLLERSDLGRLALDGPDGKPDLFPVNYVVRSGHIYFRTAPGAKLAGIARSPDVAFEADGWDGSFRWSIVVKAVATTLRLVDDDRSSSIASAHPSGKPTVVRLIPSAISGRRFRDARVIQSVEAVPEHAEPVDRKPIHIPHFAPPQTDEPSA